MQSDSKFQWNFQWNNRCILILPGRIKTWDYEEEKNFGRVILKRIIKIGLMGY